MRRDRAVDRMIEGCVALAIASAVLFDRTRGATWSVILGSLSALIAIGLYAIRLRWDQRSIASTSKSPPASLEVSTKPKERLEQYGSPLLLSSQPMIIPAYPLDVRLQRLGVKISGTVGGERVHRCHLFAASSPEEERFAAGLRNLLTNLALEFDEPKGYITLTQQFTFRLPKHGVAWVEPKRGVEWVGTKRPSETASAPQQLLFSSAGGTAVPTKKVSYK